MKKKQADSANRPASGQIERVIRRRELAEEARKVILRAVKTLIVMAAAGVLIANLLFPTIQVQRGSMSPTLRDGEQLIFVKAGGIKRGDIVAFHLGSQIMIKRVIATAGEWVDIDANGTVRINGAPIAEPYLSEKSYSECDIELPIQVPDNQLFVLGDNRTVSMDSRSADFGTIHREEILGKALLRIWPFTRIGFVK